MPIRILKRDSFARTIQVECPHCMEAANLGLKEIGHLDEGAGIAFACGHCYRPIDVPPRELVIDGRLQMVRLATARFMVTFAPSTGPIGGVPAQLDDGEALDAFLKALGVPPHVLRQSLDDLAARLVVVRTIRLALHRLKRVRLIA